MTEAITCVILSNGLDSFKEIRGALTMDGRVRILAGGNDAEQLFPEIVRLKPSATIVALGREPEHTLRLIERLTTECPSTAVISAAHDASAELILKSMRAGAREFLRLPVIAEELKTVVNRIAEVCAEKAEAPKKRGRMIAIFSSKGGCGTSFLATNVAAAMSSSTVLVDLNLQAGDLPLFLGVQPRYSLADLVENRARVDDSLITSFLTTHSSSLSLLAAPLEADSADDIRPEHIFETLERLRTLYDFVVLDPQHTFDSITLAALDQADDILLVLTLDIPAIRSAQRSLGIFDRLGYPRNKIKVVVNRWSKQIDLDLREVEKFLGQPVVGFIPSDYQTAVTSINLGQPLVHSDSASRIAVEIKRIASAIIGDDVTVTQQEPKRNRLWSSVFKRDFSYNTREALTPSTTR